MLVFVVLVIGFMMLIRALTSCFAVEGVAADSKCSHDKLHVGVAGICGG